MWVNIELEEVVDARRIAEVADDIRAVSKMFVTLVFDYRILVTILGGRRPNEVGKSKHAEGAWGTYNGDDGNWKTSVPLALEHVGRILGTLLVDGLGFPAGAEEGFGLARRARDCVSKGLTGSKGRQHGEALHRLLPAAGSRRRLHAHPAGRSPARPGGDG